MSENHIVSAIVPVYNSSAYIAECLDSLILQSRKFDEIIVVDDGSTDNTREIVQKYPIKLIQLNHGERSKARNTGWRKAKGNIIAFIESDSVYSKNWLEEVLETFSKGFDAVIDRREVYKPKTFVAKMNAAVFEARYKNYKPFSAWIFKKSVLEKLKGFDPALTHGEDVDLGTRMLAKGFTIGVAKQAIQSHMGEPKTLLEGIKRAFSFGKKMKKFYAKHPEKKPWKKVTAMTLFVVSFLFPPLALLLFIFLYIYVFAKFLGRMPIKFVLAYPIYVIITEISFTVGFWISLFKGESK